MSEEICDTPPVKGACILSQWYREPCGDPYETWFYQLWRQALRHYAPGVPIVIVHNGGPTDPPCDDVEVISAVEMLPHGRGTPEHYVNCWRSMTHGFECLADRGVDTVIFIGQNLIVGTEFVDDCIAALGEAHILFNLGCMRSGFAFTEYLAANPDACRALWKKRLPRRAMLEGIMPRWCRELGLRVKPFPRLWKCRDLPLRPEDTFCFHSSPEEVRRFVAQRRLA